MNHYLVDINQKMNTRPVGVQRLRSPRKALRAWLRDGLSPVRWC